LVVGQAGNGAATLGEDFLATIRAELSAAVEKSGPRILKRRSDQIGGSGISSGIVEIAMLKPTCRQFDERYCAAHRNMDGFVRAMVLRVPPRSINARVSNFSSSGRCGASVDLLGPKTIMS
jgi:hypothetical protein